MKRHGMLGRFVAIGIFLAIFVFLLFPAGKGSSVKQARADSMNAYPTVCLGGWQNPSNAVGEPDISEGGSGFSAGNSAVLVNADAQIFCGGFQASDESQTPTQVILHLSWNMVFPPPPSVASDTALTSGESSTTDPDAANWENIISVATGTDGNASDTNNVSGTDTTELAPEAIPPEPTSATDTTVNDEATTTTATGTSLRGAGANFLSAFFVQEAFADASDTVDTSTDASATPTPAPTLTSAPLPATSADAPAFLDVEYSLDGQNWQDLGQVSADNWQNFSVAIPVSSWDDIGKLQIEINPVTSADNPPMVYLDGMWLAVDNNQSIGDVLGTGAAIAITDLGNALNGAVDSAASGIANVITSLLPAPPSATSTPTTPATATATTSSAPLPPAHQYAFVLASATIPVDVKSPSWVPADHLKNYLAGLAKQTESPSVILTDNYTLQISGTCTESDYTLLLFADRDGYENDPSLALMNRASPCVNGQFSTSIKDSEFPKSIASGTYYLVVADQPQRGPWQPHPVLYPITITATPNP